MYDNKDKSATFTYDNDSVRKLQHHLNQHTAAAGRKLYHASATMPSAPIQAHR